MSSSVCLRSPSMVDSASLMQSRAKLRKSVAVGPMTNSPIYVLVQALQPPRLIRASATGCVYGPESYPQLNYRGARQRRGRPGSFSAGILVFQALSFFDTLGEVDFKLSQQMLCDRSVGSLPLKTGHDLALAANVPLTLCHRAFRSGVCVTSQSRSTTSNGTTSRLANRCRTASSRASTVAYVMNASTSTCSPISTRRATSSRNGGSTTTPTDRTRASKGSHRLSSQYAPIRGSKPDGHFGAAWVHHVDEQQGTNESPVSVPVMFPRPPKRPTALANPGEILRSSFLDRGEALMDEVLYELPCRNIRL
jgi:hypothetical protein